MRGNGPGRLPALRRAGWLAPLALLGLSACQLEDDLVVRMVSSSAGSGAQGGSGAQAGTGAQSGTGGEPNSGGQSGTGGMASACDPTRATILAPSATGAVTRCAGWAARRSFGHALCSCEGVAAPIDFTTAAVGGMGRDGGAAVGINGDYAGSAYVRFDGSLTLAGTVPFETTGAGLDVTGDFRARPAVSAIGPIVVGRDAWLLDVASSDASARIARDLRLGPGGALDVPAVAFVGGQTLNESFDLAPPCACAPADLLGVAEIVADVVTSNDNVNAGVSLDGLTLVESATTVTLSCGRYAFRSIGGSAPITLRVSGNVVLAVEGDVVMPRDFTLELDPGATLDWFVLGSFDLHPNARIGDVDRLGDVRVYTLGSNDIALPGTATAVMNLYAPQANVTVGVAGGVYGALFAKSVTSSLLLHVSYDRAVLHADEQCNEKPPQICSSCDGCGATTACVAGTCSACTSDTDCCFPFVCENGACEPLTRPDE
jgi:hypothetical protein